MRISDHEKKIRLYNTVRDCVMLEVDKLRSEPNNVGIVQANAAVESLKILISAIKIQNGGNDTSWNWGKLRRREILNTPLSTIDAMLSARFAIDYERIPAGPGESYDAEIPASSDLHLSVRQALNISRTNLFNSLFSTERATWGPFIGNTDALINVEQALAAKDIKAILNENLTVATSLNENLHSRKINAHLLCDKISADISVGDLREDYDIGSSEVNTLVSAGALLGPYNALMLASKLGKIEFVRYFVEEKHADLTLKGGVLSNFTALDYAKQQKGWFSSTQNHVLIDYLKNKTHASEALNESFWTACKIGDIDTVRRLLTKARILPNLPGMNSITPLLIAAENNHIDIVRILLADARVLPNQAKDDGVTPFFIAAQNNHFEVVRVLLADARVLPNQAMNNGTTPLCIASNLGHIEVVRIMIADARILPNNAMRNGSPPIFLAALYGHAEIVRILLADQRVLFNQAITLFCIESARRQMEVMRPILFENSRVLHNRQSLSDALSGASQYGSTNHVMTLLLIAVQNNQIDVVHVLLADARVLPNQAMNEGRTPLYIAAQMGHIEIVRALLANDRVLPNQAINSGATPLFIAAQIGHIEIVRALLADDRVLPNQAMNSGATPLFIAAQKNHSEVVRVLLADARVLPNQALTACGTTPFCIAAYRGNIEVVRIMLKDAKVLPNQAMNNGSTPVFFAARDGKADIVRILLSDARVLPFQANNDGSTPLRVAMENNHNEIVQILLSYALNLSETEVVMLHANQQAHLTSMEIEQLESTTDTEIKSDLTFYINLQSRLELENCPITMERPLRDDAVLLVKQYDSGEQWKPVPGTSYLFDKNSLYSALSKQLVHPLTRDLIFDSTQYHDHQTRYVLHQYYDSSESLTGVSQELSEKAHILRLYLSLQQNDIDNQSVNLSQQELINRRLAFFNSLGIRADIDYEEKTPSLSSSH